MMLLTIITIYYIHLYFVWWLIHSMFLLAYALTPLEKENKLYLFKCRIPIIIVCVINMVFMAWCLISVQGDNISNYKSFIGNPVFMGIHLNGYQINEIMYLIDIAVIVVCKMIANKIEEKREFAI